MLLQSCISECSHRLQNKWLLFLIASVLLLVGKRYTLVYLSSIAFLTFLGILYLGAVYRFSYKKFRMKFLSLQLVLQRTTVMALILATLLMGLDLYLIALEFFLAWGVFLLGYNLRETSSGIQFTRAIRKGIAFPFIKSSLAKCKGEG